MLHKHQCHKGKDSEEVGLERKENRKCAQRLKDTMREKRQKARREWMGPRRQKERRRQRTSKDKKAKWGRNCEDNEKETETEGRQRQQPGPRQSCLSSCTPILLLFPHPQKISLHSNNNSLPILVWTSFLFLVAKTNKQTELNGTGFKLIRINYPFLAFKIF